MDEACQTSRSREKRGRSGWVVARRLSHSEFAYVLQDLTGLPSTPSYPLPVDPANEQGFDNTGESLSVSPALIKSIWRLSRGGGSSGDAVGYAPRPVSTETDRNVEAANCGILSATEYRFERLFPCCLAMEVSRQVRAWGPDVGGPGCGKGVKSKVSSIPLGVPGRDLAWPWTDPEASSPVASFAGTHGRWRHKAQHRGLGAARRLRQRSSAKNPIRHSTRKIQGNSQRGSGLCDVEKPPKSRSSHECRSRSIGGAFR